MSWLLAIAIGAILAAGIFLTLSRSVLRVVIGISLIGSAVNLMLFASGRVGSGAPPIIEEGLQVLAGSTNPLPQALVLTAIVIGFALVCFSLVLALTLKQTTDVGDTRALRDAEPPLGADGKPPVLEDSQR